MKIFQNSVLNKYLKSQDQRKIDEAYALFTAYFHNAEIQRNIRNSKEEQFQEGFLRELFVKVLGYTLNPKPNFNLTTELKNEKGAKKTDGAILKNGKALAVIELKGTDTKDLNKVNEQAFNYKNNHADCIYVITSNFEKLRFFIHNAVEHIEFNLFTLTKKDFKILWLCLGAENLLGGVPAKIKEDSSIVEENVTKQLYKDYSAFKNELWQNICKNRPDLDKLLLFKKTQKLLDRFLFIFFAEDSGLLPPNSITQMVDRYTQLIRLDAKKPLYEIFKQYFGYLNKGQKGETPQDEIFAYNGGLFLSDEILDNITIDDDVLKPHVLKMTAYDFQSDVDVNILGHIFENSLNEIENVTAQLEGQEIDKSKTKRKKDGVFYTPKYITKYIVENTVGKLCEEKKAELQIIDEEYAKGRKKRKKAAIKILEQKLKEYRDWLLQITICDPACGSGAFLNQALEFLMNEHAYIDELQASLFEATLVFQDVSNHVLENNLFGVDINEESVEIAKLSLWLRTAQKGRKLTSLNNNIKCGNSLIDDPKVAGDKAFNWKKEFPQVFGKQPKGVKKQPKTEVEPDYLSLIEQNAKLAEEKAKQAAELSNQAIEYSQKVYEYAQKIQEVNEPAAAYGLKKGGFDVVIGNPPYVQLQSMGEMSDKLKSCGFETYHKGADLYCLFTEKGYNLLKKGGLQSFIMPNKWMLVAYGKPLRKFLSKTELRQVLNFGDIQFFEGAATIVCIFVTQKDTRTKNVQVLSLNKKTYKGDFLTEVSSNIYDYPSTNFDDKEWIIRPEGDSQVLDQMKAIGTAIKDLPVSIYRGILTGYNDAFYIDEAKRKELISEDSKSVELIKPMIRGRDIIPYGITDYEYLISTFPAVNIDIEKYPAIKEHLLSFGYDRLKQTGGKGSRKKTSGEWFETQDSIKYYKEFSKPKIIYPNMTSVFPFMYDESGILGNQKCFILSAIDNNTSLLYLTALLNSSLSKLWIWYNCPELLGGTREISKVYFEHFPVAKANPEQVHILEEYTKSQIEKTKELQTEKSNFLNTLQEEKGIEKMTKKLAAFNELEYDDFKKELRKKKIKIAMGEENNEWRDYFNKSKQKINELQTQINQTDNEIDKMVYELYELTAEEIEIVENSGK